MSVQPDKAREIFVAAMGKDPAARQELLDAACGDDAGLRRHVEALLQADADAGSFLDRPAAAASTEAQYPADAGPGTAIGPYKLIEPVGEGGMGIVWLAQQAEPVRRLVALKLIKAGMDSRQVVARFEAERQALALMDHPSIAKVLDGGSTPSGRPYFVMELVKGQPITRYCDEHRLTPRQRLELFLPVCHALQHAHQKGVIHRDLKPSNVLVASYDGKPVPKVIDFGVAKAAGQPLTDKTLVTGLGNIVGTLEYMSPEQAEVNQLDVDTRSDIYSLGVLLYELLAGSPPFSRNELEKAGMLEMLRVIREQEPSRPSTKLSTAEGLPTLAANRGTEPAKLTKLVRGELDWIVMKALEKDRNRRYETANGFAMDVQRYLADETVLACPPSVSYRLRKFVRRNKSKVAFAAVVLLFLAALGGGVAYSIGERASRQARVTAQVELVLDEVDQLMKAQKWPDALAAAKRAEAAQSVEGAASESRRRVQQTLADLHLVRLLEDIRASTEWKGHGFDFRTAAERYAAAFRETGIDLDRLSAEAAGQRIQSRTPILAALIPALDAWAVCRTSTGDKAGAAHLNAVAAFVDSNPLRQKIRQALAAQDLRELRTIVLAPDLTRYDVYTLKTLGWALTETGQVDSALRVLTIARREYPADFWVHYELGRAFDKQGADSLKLAEGSYWAALALRPGSTAALNNLGNVLRRQQKLPEAIACFQRALELDPKFAFAHQNLGVILCDDKHDYDGAIAAFREAIRLQPNDVTAYHNLGNALRAKRNYDEAVAAYQQAIHIKPADPEAHVKLGYALIGQGKYDDAMASVKEALRLRPAYPEAIVQLGIFHDVKGKIDEAIAYYREANRVDPAFPEGHFRLAFALFQKGNRDEALAEFRQAIKLKPNHAEANFYLGLELFSKGQFDEAKPYLRKAIEFKTLNLAQAHLNLGIILEREGKLTEAIATYEIAIESNPGAGGLHSQLARLLTTCADAKMRDPTRAMKLAQRAVDLAPGYYVNWHILGIAFYRVGKWDEARRALEKSCQLEKSTNGKGNTWQWLFLAMVHWQMGHKEEALSWYDRAVKLENTWPEEVRRYEAEAAELLSVPAAKRPKIDTKVK